MYLEELTGSITLENLEVECKARLDRNNPQSWIKRHGWTGTILKAGLKQSAAFQTPRAEPFTSALKTRLSS